jgi:hypothetical protein
VNPSATCRPVDMYLLNSARSHTAAGVAACVSWLPFVGTGWSPLTANVHGLARDGVDVTCGVAAGAGGPGDPQQDSVSAAARDKIAVQMPRPACERSPRGRTHRVSQGGRAPWPHRGRGTRRERDTTLDVGPTAARRPTPRGRRGTDNNQL